MNKVFGIGWAKTGTTTLGKCFRILGFHHQSHRIDLVNDLAEGRFDRIFSIVAKKESFEDWPWILLYKELDVAFPGGRFVLTTRDTQRWLRSYRNMLNLQGKASAEMNKIRRILYGLPFPNVSDQQLIDRYLSHNQRVIEYFWARPQDLLVVDWERGDGWDKVCHFLEKEIPTESFPHENRGRFSAIE